MGILFNAFVTKSIEKLLNDCLRFHQTEIEGENYFQKQNKFNLDVSVVQVENDEKTKSSNF